MNRLFSLLFLFPVFLTAQTVDSTEAIHRLQIGGGFGIMQHEVNFTPAASVQTLQGNTFGIGLRYFDNHFIGFQAELNYVQAGWKEVLDPDFATLYERTTNYVELQLLTQLSIGKGFLQPMIQAGPYLSVPIGESETIPAEYVPSSGAVPEYYGLELPFRLNYGLQAGAGLNLELGSLTLQLEGRYLAGFNDLIRTGSTVAAISRRRGLGGRISVFYAVGASSR